MLSQRNGTAYETGTIQQEKFGTDTPLYHKQRFNQRGQLWDMRLSTVPFTAQLMSRAANMVVLRILRKESGPIADFDLVYFMEVIKEFADDHEALRMILNGKGDELNWMAEEE